MLRRCCVTVLGIIVLLQWLGRASAWAWSPAVATTVAPDNLFDAPFKLLVVVWEQPYFLSKNVVAQYPVLFDCIVNGHSKSTQHDCNQSIKSISVFFGFVNAFKK